MHLFRRDNFIKKAYEAYKSHQEEKRENAIKEKKEEEKKEEEKKEEEKKEEENQLKIKQFLEKYDY